MPPPSNRRTRSRVAVALLTSFAAAMPARTIAPQGAPVPATDSSAGGAARGRAAQRGAAVAVIDLRDVDLSTVHTLSDLLSARVPGVSVRRRSGVAGSGATLWMRGPTGDAPFSSAFGVREPLLVVDGVRADATQQSLVLDDLTEAPSRLDDFRLEDFATVELLRGPAAAALYGAGAERGVISLTTRRGDVAAPRLGIVAQTGVATNPARFAPIYGRIDTRTGTIGCTLIEQADDVCTPGPLMRRDALGGRDVYRVAVESRVGLSVQGAAADRLRYYVGGGLDRQPGVSELNDDRRSNVRARVDVRALPSLDLTATGGYVDRATTLPYLGGSPRDALTRALQRQVDGSEPALPASLTASGGFAVRQDVARATAGASLRWTPAPWLRASAGYGADDARRNEQAPDLPGDVGGDVFRNGSGRVRSTTLGANVELGFARGLLAGLTTAGLERTSRERSTYEMLGRRAESDLSPPFISSATTALRSRVLGLYLAQRISWSDRLVFEGGLRRDRETRSATTLGTHPFVETSWALGGRPRSALRLWADDARVRGAYGVVSTGPATLGPVGYGDLIGVPALGGVTRRERTREAEAGLDVTYVGGAIGLAITGYEKTTIDGVVGLTLAFSSGSSQAVPVGGDVRNRGIEAELRASLLRSASLRWDATIAFAANGNRVTRTSMPLNFLAGPVSNYPLFELVREGESVGTLGGYRLVSFADRNGDGIIAAFGCSASDPSSPGCEFTLGESVVPFGVPYPTREASLASSLGLGRYVTVSGRLDYLGGMRLFNGTRWYRCFGSGNGGECNDPATPLADQAEVASSFPRRGTGFVEDASFVKLRELAVAVRLPARWTGPAGALAITLAGRNLATFTRYTGADPEVGMAATPLVAGELFTQPQVRTFVVRAEVGR